MDRCRILLENEISIFKKLVNRRKHEVLQNVLVNGCSDVGFQKTQWTNTSRWHWPPNHHRLWKLNTGLQATWAMSFSTFLQTLGPWFPNEIQNLLSSEKRTLDRWAAVQFFFLSCHLNVIFGMCLKTSWFGVYANELNILARLQKRASHIRLSALYIYSDKQLVEATWLREREPVFSRTYESQMHWKWNETARCYRARTALTRHRRGSMDRDYYIFFIIFTYFYYKICLLLPGLVAFMYLGALFSETPNTCQ